MKRFQFKKVKIYIIAGEASGDLHGSHLISAIKKVNPALEIRCWGGDLMKAAGGQLVRHYRDLAFMGFWEVMKNIRTIFRNLEFCKKDIEGWIPDIVVFIDYPGFNIRMANWAKKAGFKTFYYISPQLWAWHSSRVNQIRKSVDKMAVILPFEKEFYEKHGMKVDFVGHPLLDVIRNFKVDKGFANKWRLNKLPIISLLPGSRKQEIGKMLPVMLKIVQDFPSHQFVIAGAPAINSQFYKSLLTDNSEVKIVEDNTYQLLALSHAALVTSGTATLETALFGVPEIVCYKGTKFSYYIAKKLVYVKYIALVNLIFDRQVVPELIQNDFNTINLKEHLNLLLQPETYKQMKSDFKNLQLMLGTEGAAQKTAKLIFELAVEVV